jgi:hypothetical protein
VSTSERKDNVPWLGSSAHVMAASLEIGYTISRECPFRPSTIPCPTVSKSMDHNDEPHLKLFRMSDGSDYDLQFFSWSVIPLEN